MVKRYGVVLGGPCDYVSPSPKISVFWIFRLGQTFGSRLGDCGDGELLTFTWA